MNLAVSKPDCSAPWIPDLGNGTYRNPILHADYSDPDVIRVGEDYYLVSSSFNCTPGLPILHSRDLVNWSIVNHAVKNLPHPRFSDPQHGHGIWAPALRHHDGKFWIVFPMPDEGLYVTTATDPYGQWSDPHLLLAGNGLIDPCPLWDDDGKAYIVHAYAGSRAGIRNILHVRPASPDLSEMLGEGQYVARIDPKLPALEGPKWHKRNGWYYIFAPAGGVPTGWQSVFRSKNVYGPYEEKIALAQRGTAVNGPHQGALVDTPDGEWWFVHFQDADLYGRILHLQPARWEDDWPLLGVDQDQNGVGKPAFVHRKPSQAGTISIPQTSDDFDSERLGLQWQWHANHRESWYSLTENPGAMRLYPQFVEGFDLLTAGNLLLQKFPAREFVVDTEVEPADGHGALHAGLVVMGMEYAALDVQQSGDTWVVRLQTNSETRGERVIDPGPVCLRVIVSSGGKCRFGMMDPVEGFYQIGPAFYAKPGRWIGAKVGIYCLRTNAADPSGHADFSYFRVHGGAVSAAGNRGDFDVHRETDFASDCVATAGVGSGH